ncbi:hypothetical protein GCM10020254_28500 [Streptomyces goshikiensis]
MDVSVLYFAIPAITRELDPSATQQLWIFDSYAFALSGLLITMGSLGDRIGRRRLLLAGAAAFGLASVGAAYATSAEMLIAARVLLGIGGATLMPSTLALVRNLFQDARQRGKAIALWSGAMTGGIALGSVMSGLMLNHFWWGSVFLINVPAMLLLLVLVPVLVPEFKDPAPRPLRPAERPAVHGRSTAPRLRAQGDRRRGLRAALPGLPRRRPGLRVPLRPPPAHP